MAVVEFRQIRYFVEVAALGSFNQAASKLHLTQPAISRQVKALEEELNVPLLVRGKRSVSLTHEGEIFYEEAQDLLAHVDRVKRSVSVRNPVETLRVGYIPSLVAGIMPRAIARFRKLEKSIKVDLLDMTPQEVCDRATRDLLDVAIIPRGVESSLRGVQLIEIDQQKPVLIVSKTHPMARLSKIPPQALKGAPLYGLGRRDFPEYAPRLRAILKPFGVTPSLVSQDSDGTDSLFATMAAEGGAAILTDGIIDSLPPHLVMRPFSPALAPLVILAAIFVSKPSLTAEKFVQILQEEGSRKMLK